MFEHMESAESNYKSVVEPSYENLLGHNPTILVTVG